MEEGEGIPAKLVVNHRAKTIDCEAGKVTFEDGTTIEADLIVGADGIRVRTRSFLMTFSFPDFIYNRAPPVLKSALSQT